MNLMVLVKLARSVPRYGRLVYSLYRDPRAPRRWKIGLALVVGLIVTPFVNVPEFIPVLGQMETVGLLVLAIRASLRFVPEELIAEHEAAIAAGTSYFHRDMHRAADEAGEIRSRIGN